MPTPSARMKYAEFMKLSNEERRATSEYFRKKYPDRVPVILNCRCEDLPVLSSCKFLIELKNQLYGQLNKIRSTLLKNSSGKLKAEDGLFFSHAGKLLNNNKTISEFMAQQFKDIHHDSWLHITYDKMQTF